MGFVWTMFFVFDLDYNEVKKCKNRCYFVLFE